MKKALMKGLIACQCLLIIAPFSQVKAAEKDDVNMNNEHLSKLEKDTINQNLQGDTIKKYPKPAGKDVFGSMVQLEDTYKDLKGKVWSIDNAYSNKHRTMVFAPHGGQIEKGSTELAHAISDRGNYDFFSFNGLKKKDNHSLHVTSTHYDEPTLEKELKNKQYSISVHGAMGDKTHAVYVGGANESLINHSIHQLKKQGIDARKAPKRLAGKSSKNIVNRNKTHQGVQLELSEGLRKDLFKKGFYHIDERSDQNNWTPTMYKFAKAMTRAVNDQKIDDL